MLELLQVNTLAEVYHGGIQPCFIAPGFPAGADKGAGKNGKQFDENHKDQKKC